jgi:hypothetical protein
MEQEEFEALTTDEMFRKAVMRRFDAMDAQFISVNTRLSNQDVAIAQNTELTKKVSDETKGVREFMKDGASAAALFCRMAAAWRFMWKWVVVAIGGPSIFLYSLFYYAVHGHFPPWFTAVASFFIR